MATEDVLDLLERPASEHRLDVMEWEELRDAKWDALIAVARADRALLQHWRTGDICVLCGGHVEIPRGSVEHRSECPVPAAIAAQEALNRA
jgi:hypothetical protein